MKETIIGIFGFLIGILIVANGVAGGWIFIIGGALLFIKQGVKILKRTNKTSNVRNNEQSPNSKKAISSHKEIKSTHYEKSGSRSEVDDRSLSVGKERGIEESEKPDDQLTDLKAVSTTSGGYAEPLRNEEDTNRKPESEIRKDKTESKIKSKAANADTPVEPLKNYFGFYVSDNDIQRVCSADLGTITAGESA